jgi:hypothetical protein
VPRTNSSAEPGRWYTACCRPTAAGDRTGSSPDNASYAGPDKSPYSAPAALNRRLSLAAQDLADLQRGHADLLTRGNPFLPIIANWLFVFNSNFLRMNEAHRSAPLIVPAI